MARRPRLLTGLGHDLHGDCLPPRHRRLQVRGGGVGDLLCKVVVETPVKLTDEQRELLQQLKQSLDSNSKHSPRGKSWFDGVKSFFDDLKP